MLSRRSLFRGLTAAAMSLGLQRVPMPEDEVESQESFSVGTWDVHFYDPSFDFGAFLKSVDANRGELRFR